MEKPYALTLSSLLSLLAAAGFIKNNKTFIGMNVDKSHSLIRIPVTLLTLASTRGTTASTRTALKGVGILYLLIGCAGLFNKRLGGVLPAGLTKFDYVYHFLSGALTLWMGSRSGRMLKPQAPKA
jgi:hypothetical protein